MPASNPQTPEAWADEFSARFGLDLGPPFAAELADLRRKADAADKLAEACRKMLEINYMPGSKMTVAIEASAALAAYKEPARG